MRTRWNGRAVLKCAAVAAVVAAATLALAACGSSATPGAGAPTPSASAADPGAGGAASGSKLAPGLYDLDDGTVQAVGTVEHRDLEGGFWAVIGGTQAGGDEGQIVAVIVNGDEFAEQFRAHEGLSFIVAGARAGGTSTRMAGPEITATTVTLAGEGGPAE